MENGESEAVFVNKELSFIGQNITAIPEELWQNYGSDTRRLDLSFNSLRSLDGLENFPKLEELILDSNALDERVSFPQLHSLHTLFLNKNQIYDIDPLIETIINQIPNLTYLSLLGNVACPNQLSCSDKDEEDYQRYRYYVLFKLPQLKFLDSSPVKETERQEAKMRGQFLKVARPLEAQSIKVTDESIGKYTPLPNEVQEDGAHAGTFGVTKYVYYGKHSEGNRFIRNNDL